MLPWHQDPDTAPAGAYSLHHRLDNGESLQNAFYTQVAGPNEVGFEYVISHYERSILDDYDRERKLGYDRQEVAFYTRELQVGTREISSGNAQVYTGEDVDETARALVGYDRVQDVNGLSQNFIPHWTTHEGRIEYGTTFQITDTENGTLIDSNLGEGTYSNTSVTRNIPTPPVEAIEETNPDYGSIRRGSIR